MHSNIIEKRLAVCYNLSMNYARVKSYAKVNLTLDILGVKDGYHMLDSLVASVDIYDVISVKKRKDRLVNVTMHGMGSESIPPENNNAVRCAELFIEQFDTTGADVTVWKNIPMGAGLGGSSADVAGVLNALAKVYEVTDYDRLKAVADSVGSDCGYMLKGGFARISGRGERVERIDSNLKLNLGLLLPKQGVNTSACYKLYDGLATGNPATTEGAVRALRLGDKAALGKSLANALTQPAVALNGEISGCISELEAFDPLGVSMTGSGSGVFALFENDQFLSYAQSRYRGKARFIMTKTVIPSMEDK